MTLLGVQRKPKSATEKKNLSVNIFKKIRLRYAKLWKTPRNYSRKEKNPDSVWVFFLIPFCGKYRKKSHKEARAKLLRKIFFLLSK